MKVYEEWRCVKRGFSTFFFVNDFLGKINIFGTISSISRFTIFHSTFFGSKSMIIRKISNNPNSRQNKHVRYETWDGKLAEITALTNVMAWSCSQQHFTTFAFIAGKFFYSNNFFKNWKVRMKNLGSISHRLWSLFIQLLHA